MGDDHACARSRQIGPLPTAKRLLGPFPCSFSTRRLGPCGDKEMGSDWPCLHHSSAGRRTLCARVTVRPLRRHVAMLRFRGPGEIDRPIATLPAGLYTNNNNQLLWPLGAQVNRTGFMAFSSALSVRLPLTGGEGRGERDST